MPTGVERRAGRRRRGTDSWGRWCATALAGVLLATAQQVPARADEAVPYDEAAVHAAIFGAVVQLTEPGSAGVKDAVLTAELLDWRTANPAATGAQIAAHVAAVRAVADAAVTDSRGEDRSRFALVMAVLAKLAGTPSSGAVMNGAAVRAFLTSTVGAEGANMVPDALNLVQGGYQDAAWNTRVRDVLRTTWSALHLRAATDDALAAGWDGAFGARTGTSSRAALPTLLATRVHDARPGNPGTIGDYVPLDAIRAERDDPEAYKTLVRERAIRVLTVLDQDANTRITEVIAYSNTYVINQDPKPSPQTQEAERIKTEANKKIFEGLGSTVSVLSTLVGFADPTFGKQLETIGKAVVTSVTAINTYVTTVLGQGLTMAATAMGTAVLTGNLLGAAMSLVTLFSGGGDPNAAIKAEIGKLRDQINRLAQGIDKRFDRVETALKEMYAGLVAQLDALTKSIDEIRVNLGRIATQLQTIERKVDSMALATHVALENIARRDLNQVISTYVHHRENTGGQPIPDFVNTYYPLAESPTFRFATIDAAQEGTFTVPNGTSLADPVSVIDNYLPEGSVNYLSQLARQRVPGATWTTGPVANASAWNVAARVYNILQLENPAFAAQVNSGRANAIADAGDTINNRVREFNRPETNGTTNALFRGLMDDYRNAMSAWNAQVENVRKAVVWNNTPTLPEYDLWGSPDQAVAARIPEAGTLGRCTGTGAGRATPSTLLRATLPNPFHLADHAMPPGHRPQFSSCYDAVFVNVEENEGPRFHTWRGDLQITVKSRVKWAGGDWQDAQNQTRVFPIGTFCSWSVRDPEPNGYCYDETYYLNQRWAGTYKPAFESAPIAVNGTAVSTARTKAAAMLAGRQKYFYRVMLAGTGPTEPSSTTWDVSRVLWQKGKAVANSVRLLQAYSELGWATALELDDTLNGLLFGSHALPGDWSRPRTDTDQSGNQHFRNAFGQAVWNYNDCTQGVDWDPCVGDRSGFDPQRDLPQYGAGCPQAEAPNKPREPVSACLASAASIRVGLLHGRYDHWSARSLSFGHTEGLPKVTATVDMTRAANINLH
ncbi:hypothetical protein ACI2K4_09975 [Micromonospora sp. NPDC050397]|uniref:HAMP domain-containing protein n=1 Tax=Micromonospora sp. NPDC050397 TaxID=3364279 RepID=UPI00384FD479